MDGYAIQLGVNKRNENDNLTRDKSADGRIYGAELGRLC